MAGTFELFTDEDSRIRFRLVAPDGSVLACYRQGRFPRCSPKARERQ